MVWQPRFYLNRRSNRRSTFNYARVTAGIQRLCVRPRAEGFQHSGVVSPQAVSKALEYRGRMQLVTQSLS